MVYIHTQDRRNDRQGKRAGDRSPEKPHQDRTRRLSHKAEPAQEGIERNREISLPTAKTTD